MALEPGSSIGSYTITREVGRGGMGVVYLARDTRLERDVAIKALPEELASDPARLKRFEREARTLASLSHPNLAGIYGIEEQDGARYLILEYVEGETIADILDRGALNVDDALELAVQIAAGVEAAHEAGVIHRDLKPANIKVTPEGKAKVLDFGLARSDDSAASSSSMNLSNSPTVTSPVQHSPTIAGAILGTAPYMSPEQARGRKVDKRTDIWSFAVLVYEMLTGVGPFHGETATDSIGAILHKDVDLGLLPRETPRSVRRVLERCLARDKGQRFRDIGDVRLELAHARGEGSVDAGPAHAGGKGRGVLVRAAIALLLGAVGWFVGQQMRGAERVASDSLWFELPIGETQARFGPGQLAHSPTEPVVAYIGLLQGADPREPRSICVHDLRTGETRRLDGTDNAGHVGFSPGGSEIVYSWFDPNSRREEMRRVSVGGGPSLRVYLDSDGQQYHMSFVQYLNESEMLGGSQDLSMWYRVSVATGEMTALGAMKGLPVFQWGGQAWMLDGERFFLTMAGIEDTAFAYTTYLCDLRTMEAELFLPQSIGVHHVGDGRVVFGRDEAICVARVDESFRVVGAPVPMIDGLSNGYSFTVSGDGHLFAILGGEEAEPELVAVTPEGERRKLVQASREYGGDFDISDDGRRLVTNILNEDGIPIAHLIDIDTGNTRAISADGVVMMGARFAPDDRVIALEFFGPKYYELRIVDVDGVRATERVLPEADGLGEQRGGVMTPDGECMVFIYIPNEAGADSGIYCVDLTTAVEDRRAVAVLTTEAHVQTLALSPDGRYLVYVTDASGRMEVVLQAFDAENPGSRERVVPVSFEGGRWPLWSRDGSKLFFFDPDGNLMRAVVATDAKVEVSNPEQVLAADELGIATKWGHQVMDTLPGGGEFVYVRNATNEEKRAAYILNWADFVLAESE